MYSIYSTTQEAWDAMYDAIEQAQKSVYWEVYIFIDDDIGKRFFDLLEKKASQGIDVKLIIDSWGSFGISKKRVATLKAAGVDLQMFSERKHKYRGIFKQLVSRTHRKILVVDGNIGFVGGVNVDKRFADWLDVHIRVRGEAVRSLSRSFAKMYVLSGGDRSKVSHLLKYKYRIRKKLQEIEWIFDHGNIEKSQAHKKYIEALYKARERVILFSPYYFPDKKLLYALWQAKKRGVRVDLLIPFRTDLRVATYAAYAWFSIMKRLGVDVRLTKKMMHGKGVVVDDEWAMVGSSNLEFGSFRDYYEANVRIREKAFVKKLKEKLEEWIADSQSLDDVQWSKRGWFHKFQEWIAVKIYRLWHKSAPDNRFDKE
ncbi:hypothetical protein H6758_04575 [Candidatus Nomurabacteria bacterium]|nr:hypothetical protein [Candidatus Nomurabacteria bacterium]